MSFEIASEKANLPVKIGLQAFEAHDRICVKIKGGTRLTGSANLDEAYRAKEGQSNRWDYGVGFRMGDEHYAVWIEPHTATSAKEITTMIRKLSWLKDKLATDNFDELRKLTDRARSKSLRTFWWVTTGRICLRPGTPDANRLANAGLNFPCRSAIIDRT